MDIGISKMLLDVTWTSEVLVVLGILLNIFCALFHQNIKPKTSNILTIILMAAAMSVSLFGPSLMRALIYISALVCVLFAVKFTKRLTHKICYFNSLLFTLVLGCIFLITCSNFLTMFVSLEIISVASYLLVAIFMSKKGLEASIKYFVQGVVASCLMLFAISYIYGIFGSISFAYIAQTTQLPMHGGLLPIANAILFCALAFKLAVVPFCSWVCETLEGADFSVGLVLATVQKVAGVAIFIKLAQILSPAGSVSQLILILMAILTLIFANLLALRQTSIKRFLAYSTVSHAGYMLFAVAMVTMMSMAAAKFYLISYLIATFGVWAGFGVFYLNNRGKEIGENLEDLQSIAYQNPYFATMMAICLFSLAGMPPMLGFVAKFYLFIQVLSAGVWVTMPMLVVIFASVVALFYYGRVISYFFKRTSDQGLGKSFGKFGQRLAKKTTTARAILTVASLLLIILIFLSKPILELCLFT